MQHRVFSVRDWSKREVSRSNSVHAFRIYVSEKSLSSLGLEVGGVCEIQRGSLPTAYALVWVPTPEDKINENVVRISLLLRRAYDLKYEEPVSLCAYSGALKEAHKVLIQEIDGLNGAIHNSRKLTSTEKPYWIGAVRESLYGLEVFYSSLELNDIHYCGDARSFSLHVDSVGPDDLTLYKFSPATTYDLLDEGHVSSSPLRVLGDRLGGLHRQVERINKILRWYDKGSLPSDDMARIQLRAGIILHGSTGSGKSLLLKAISEAGWEQVFAVNNTVKPEKGRTWTETLDSIVQEALHRQPSVLVIDDLHMLVPKQGEEDAASLRKLHALYSALDRTRGTRTLLVATTKETRDIQPIILAFFSQSVHLPAPDPKGRREILRLACDLPKDAISELLDKVGDNTHGYSAQDIFHLVETCALESDPDHVPFVHFPNPLLQWAKVKPIVQAIRPSVMNGVSIERPQVVWANVGGNEEVRKVLERAIEWPKRYPERMKRLHIGAIKGVLLYGPPGCSKTLVAKAVATSSTWNFIPVRGPEILKMYVGESERALRDLFRTARSAAPSIIFFDEIDALGMSRGTEGKLGGPQANVLTTLLTELDGIEPLKDVFVLAATNAPEILDPALIRAGRLEQRIYMGLPDERTRRDILLMHRSSWAEDVDVDILAKKAVGYTGAEVVRLLEHAGRLALTEGLESGVTEQDDEINMNHFQKALEDVKRDVTEDMLRRYLEFSERS